MSYSSIRTQIDKENTLSIFKLFSKLAKEQGYCVVVVTHDLELAGMSDKVFKLDDGVLKEESNAG